MLVEAELDFTTAMLALPANPSFTEMRQQPLAFLTQAQEDLRGCVSSPPPEPPGPVLARRPRSLYQCRRALPILTQPLLLADGCGGSFASALRETEALAAEAADSQENSKSGQQGEGVSGC